MIDNLGNHGKDAGILIADFVAHKELFVAKERVQGLHVFSSDVIDLKSKQ